jgi:putative transposase/transposase-like zinc-binding protein
VEVGDIFRAHGEVYRQQHVLTPDQQKVMRAIEACRTEVLGGHLDACDRCGHCQPSYNSCRDRHCPKCQSLTQAKWIEERMERLLPVHYFHVVFTLPQALRPVARRNQRAVYKLLFEAATKTLLTLGEDPKRLGGQLGITAVLHTWTRELEFHPHLHCIVTGGGLSPDGTTWIPARRKYLFPVKVLSRLFRGLFLDGLKRAHQAGDVRFDGGDLQEVIDALYQTEWVVYAKWPFGGPQQVFQYLGRYTHRVGISNQRLIAMDERGISFATKNGDTITLAPQEFIRRFLLHVLPPGFVKIRHYGLWASGNVSTRLAAAQGLLPAAPSAALPAPVETNALGDLLDWQNRLLRLVGIDVTRCPRCGEGRMIRQPLDSAAPTGQPDTS